MKKIAKHCSDLSKLISGYDHEIEWPNQFNWLNVASGIVKVEFDIMRFVSYLGYCRDADQFDGAREELLERYITELTRFTYIWGALESLINDLNPPPAPQKGKINSICCYLKNRLTPDTIIFPYPDLVKQLKYVLQSGEANELNVLKRFDDVEHLSEHGIGLYVIYKLRNLFVHGSIGFPLPDEENRPISTYPQLVNISNRIVLLSLQMIWLAYYLGTGVYSSLHWESYNDDQYPIEEVLRQIHFKDYKYQNNKVLTSG